METIYNDILFLVENTSFLKSLFFSLELFYGALAAAILICYFLPYRVKISPRIHLSVFIGLLLALQIISLQFAGSDLYFPVSLMLVFFLIVRKIFSDEASKMIDDNRAAFESLHPQKGWKDKLFRSFVKSAALSFLKRYHLRLLIYYILTELVNKISYGAFAATGGFIRAGDAVIVALSVICITGVFIIVSGIFNLLVRNSFFPKKYFEI